MMLSNEKLNELAVVFKNSLPAKATHGTVEVICIDDYSEYPVTYRSETGEVVDKIVNDWDSPEALSSKALTEYLLENINQWGRFKYQYNATLPIPDSTKKLIFDQCMINA